jgi:hypothetical protein
MPPSEKAWTAAEMRARAEACEHDADYSLEMRLAEHVGYLESDEIELRANAAMLRQGAAAMERWEALKAWLGANLDLVCYERIVDEITRLERTK